MQLHGTSDKYALESSRTLSKLVIFRKFIGPVYALGFLLLFVYLELYSAALGGLFLTLLSPAFYFYAYLTKQPKSFYVNISTLVATAFSCFAVLVVYFGKELDFIYLIAYPITIAVYSISNYRYRWLVLVLSILSIAFILRSVLSTYTVMVFLTTYVLVHSFAHLFSLRIRADNVILAKLALQDSLTELKNRRALEIAMDDPKTIETLNSVIFLDIDHFKKINDEHGHVFGDEVLKAVANAVIHAIDEEDEAFRYGGEEFVVISQGASECQSKALRIQAAIERIRLLKDVYSKSEAVTFTASIGLALTQANKPLQQMVRDADAAMYHAKETGRNKVVLYDNDMQQISEQHGGV